jgi:hypothetical protein
VFQWESYEQLVITIIWIGMRKLIVIFAILLIGTILGAAAFSNYYLMKSSKIPTQESNVTQTPTIQPTSNPTATPQPTLKPTPTTPTTTVIHRPSNLTVISPTNTTYSTTTVELTYTINSKVVWSYYGLDIGGNGAGSNEYTGINELYTLHGLVPFKGNITLNLPEGTHRLLLAVQTQESRGSSVPIAYQTIDFIIDTTSTP